MEEKFIGEVVRERRIELGLTQAKLGEGICEAITISRLERNEQTPARNTVIAILQRLGLPDDRYYAVITGKEAQIDKLCNEIISYNIMFGKSFGEEKNRIREKAITSFSELEKIISKDDAITRRLIARSKVVIGKEDGEYSASEKIVLLEEAIRITHPSFQSEKIEDGYFDFEEVKLINHIAISYSDNGDHERALDIWSQLLANVDKRFSNIVPVRTQKSLILVGYSRELGIMGEYAKAIRHAQQGVDICIQYGVYQNLPELIMVLAECFYQVGKKERSKELFTEAFYLCKVVKDDINRHIAEKSLNDYFELVVD